MCCMGFRDLRNTARTSYNNVPNHPRYQLRHTRRWNMKFCLEVANLWYEPLLRGFCESRKIRISLEYQGFQRFGKNRLDLVL